MMEFAEQIGAYIERIGLLGAALIVIGAFYKDFIVTKPTHEKQISFWMERWRAAEKEKQEWREQAISSTAATNRLAENLEIRNKIDEER
jgi:hypothetical protein